MHPKNSIPLHQRIQAGLRYNQTVYKNREYDPNKIIHESN